MARTYLYVYFPIYIAILGCGRVGFSPGAAPPCPEKQVSQNVVAEEDFEGGATGWSNNATDNSEAIFSEFLGRHASASEPPTQAVSKQFALSGEQHAVRIAFDLYQIDSWDGEEFVFYVDGEIYERRGFLSGGSVTQHPMTAFLGPPRQWQGIPQRLHSRWKSNASHDQSRLLPN